MTNKVTTVVDIDIKKALGALKEVEAGFDGTESAADRVAKAVSAMAATLNSEADKADAATEALSQSLGSELVASIERSGGSVDQLVSKFRQMGLAYDDIISGSDQLAASVKDLEGAGSRAGLGLKDVGERGDQTRSVLANLVGNSAQDLGELSGVAGTAGVAIGQLAEYAADGNISIANLTKLVGPMVLLGGAVAGVTAYMSAQKREAEELARITEFLGGVQEKVAANDFRGAGEAIAGEYEDTIKVLERYGYSVEDLINGIDGERYVTRQLASDIRDLEDRYAYMTDVKNAANFTPDDLAAVQSEIQALNDVIDTINEDAAASRAAAEQRERNNRVTAEAASWFERLAGAARDASVDLADQDKAATTAANRLRDLQGELDAYVDKIGGIPDEAVTEVQAAIDSGNLAYAEKLLEQLTRPRITPLYIVPQLLDNKPVGTSSKGSAAAGSGAKGTSYAYNPGSILSSILNPSSSGGGGGGGGGGAGGGGGGAAGKSAAELEKERWDELIDRMYEYGEFSRQEYLDYVKMRISGEEKYTDAYDRYWRIRQKLEQEASREAEAAQREREQAEKEAADEAKRQAEEVARAAEKAQQAQDNLIINVYSNSLDPMAVARAIQQARRMMGSRWLNG